MPSWNEHRLSRQTPLLCLRAVHLQALQVQQHILKGMELAVGGRLRKDVWTTAAGASRSMFKAEPALTRLHKPAVLK